MFQEEKKQTLKIISHLNLDLRDSGKKLVGPCPVHGGDNKSSFQIYKISGFWKCWSHLCHESFGNTLQGFVKGILSRVKYDWPPKIASDYEVETWLRNTSHIELPKRTDIFREEPKFDMCEQDYLRLSQIPCPYYSQKFPAELLNKHKIGFSKSKEIKMYNRSIVPIYDKTKTKLVGLTGRSIFPECPQCKGYHSPHNICGDYYAPKWLHSRGIETRYILYNIWNAGKYAANSGCIFLTESVGNVLTLELQGFKNSAALFGINYSQYHEKLLMDNGVKKIIYIKDAGDAGDMAIKNIRNNSSLELMVPDLQFVEDDIAALKKDELQKLKGILNDYCV